MSDSDPNLFRPNTIHPPLKNSNPPPILDIAPPAKSKNRNGPVIVSGIASTVLALALVSLLENKGDMNVMGLHADIIIPAGAILVGVLASSGYTLAAWFAGLKIRRGLLLTVIILQIGGYFAAQYADFAARGPLINMATGKVLSFPEYFHLNTVNMAWKGDVGGIGRPVGAWGYAIRFDELLGFIVGALVSPLILKNKPYCDLCEEYMCRKSLALLPASNTKASHLFGKTAIQATSQEVLESGMTEVVQLVELASFGDSNAVATKLIALAPQRRLAKKMSRRIEVRLMSCPRCGSGWLDVLRTDVRGRRSATASMGRTEVSQIFVRALRDRKLA